MNQITERPVSYKGSSENNCTQWRIGTKMGYIEKKIVDVHTQLPTGASVPMVLDDFSAVYGMFYMLTADGFQTVI